MVLVGRRCFADAQAQLGVRPPNQTVDALVTTGWYDTALNAEVGSFAVVDPAGVLADRVGQVLRVSTGSFSVFAYVIGSASTSTGAPLALARRAFMALGPLSVGTLECVVEVVP